MNRNTLRKIHLTASVAALVFISTFWTSTFISEAFLTHKEVAVVKQGIVYALLVFVPLMVTMGVSGKKLVADHTDKTAESKRRRIKKIAMNGNLILLPAACILCYWANHGQFHSGFYLVQALELTAGATNITLLALNIRSEMKPTDQVQTA